MHVHLVLLEKTSCGSQKKTCDTNATTTITINATNATKRPGLRGKPPHCFVCKERNIKKKGLTFS